VTDLFDPKFKLPHLTEAGEQFKKDFISQIPTCPRCGGAPSVLTVRLLRNGSTQNRPECSECSKLLYFGNGQYIKNLLVWHAQDIRMDIPWANDVLLVNKTQQERQCAHGAGTKHQCPNTDVEYHHFGPKSYFVDFDKWPTAWLCREHHNNWHEEVTPGLVHDYGEHYSWNWETGRLSRYGHDYLITTDDDDVEIDPNISELMAKRELVILVTRERYETEARKKADEELFGYDDDDGLFTPGTIDDYDLVIGENREPYPKADFKYNYNLDLYVTDET
jgi:hypothetical protein